MFSLPLLTLLALVSIGSISAQEVNSPSTQVKLDATAPLQAEVAANSIMDDDEEDDGERIFSVGIKANVGGIDYDSITGEHEAYLEDAIKFAYDKTHKNSDKYVISNHLVAKEKGEPDEGNKNLSLLRGLAYVPKKPVWNSGWHTWTTLSCRFCGSERRVLSDHFLGSSDALESSAAQERWENFFCKLLRESGYEALEDAHNCRFSISHDGHGQDHEVVMIRKQ
ncbi:hypothetical protein MPSEU_000973000 [Mayamaea pseudoterrestris]|nr:hypothetical protein MPSEU_000973000 [Mayamaea pseudoterrestris]